MFYQIIILGVLGLLPFQIQAFEGHKPLPPKKGSQANIDKLGDLTGPMSGSSDDQDGACWGHSSVLGTYMQILKKYKEEIDKYKMQYPRPQRPPAFLKDLAKSGNAVERELARFFSDPNNPVIGTDYKSLFNGYPDFRAIVKKEQTAQDHYDVLEHKPAESKGAKPSVISTLKAQMMNPATPNPILGIKLKGHNSGHAVLVREIQSNGDGTYTIKVSDSLVSDSMGIDASKFNKDRFSEIKVDANGQVLEYTGSINSSLKGQGVYSQSDLKGATLSTFTPKKK